MKVTYTYQPHDVDDRFALERAHRSMDMYLALVDLATRFRGHTKYGHDLPTPGDFADILREYDLDLEKLGQ